MIGTFYQRYFRLSSQQESLISSQDRLVCWEEQWALGGGMRFVTSFCKS